MRLADILTREKGSSSLLQSCCPIHASRSLAVGSRGLRTILPTGGVHQPQG